MNTEALDIAVPLIARFEGCKLRAYHDAVGVLTIGYGHTKGVKEGDVWTQERADHALRREVSEFMEGVERLIKVPVNAHQLAALTSLAYNIGLTAFHQSTLLRKLNAGDYDGATVEFQKWNKAGGHVLNGLVARRNDERQEFIS